MTRTGPAPNSRSGGGAMSVLRLLAGALALAAVSPAEAGRAELPRAGFSVEWPDGWRRISAVENAENFRQIEIGDRELEPRLRAAAAVPVLVLVKYGDSHVGANPTVWIAVLPRASLAGESLERALAASLATMRRVDPGVVVEHQGPVRLAGLDGFSVRVLTTARVDRSTVTMRSEVWVLERGQDIVVVTAGAAPEEPPATAREIARILASIMFVPVRGR